LILVERIKVLLQFDCFWSFGEQKRSWNRIFEKTQRGKSLFPVFLYFGNDSTNFLRFAS